MIKLDLTKRNTFSIADGIVQITHLTPDENGKVDLGEVKKSINWSMQKLLNGPSLAGVTERLIAELQDDWSFENGKGYDFLCTSTGSKIELKTATKRGCRFSRSSAQGVGREKPSRECFEEDCRSKEFLIQDGVRFYETSDALIDLHAVDGATIAKLPLSIAYKKAKELIFERSNEDTISLGRE